MLNYDFISTSIDKHGNMRSFMHKIPKFDIEITISTRQVMVDRQDMEFSHNVAFSQDMTFPRDITLDLHT